MNGLDLLLLALVIAGGFYLFMAGAARLERWEDEISRREYERLRMLERDLDSLPREVLVPFDWSEEGAA